MDMIPSVAPGGDGLPNPAADQLAKTLARTLAARQEDVASTVSEDDDVSDLAANLKEEQLGATLESLDVEHPALARSCDVVKSVADRHGDGDQRPLPSFPGSPGALLAAYCAAGGTFQPFARPARYTHFFKCCAWGDAREVVATLASATAPGGDAAWLRSLLERRESSLRKPPLHAAIAGAKCLPGSDAWPLDDAQQRAMARALPDHALVVQFLVDAGARLDARDVLGDTPLHACCAANASARSLAIAGVLVKRGGAGLLAEPNRLGYTPLQCAVHGGRADVVDRLLALGDDADRRDAGGAGTLRDLAAALGHGAVVAALERRPGACGAACAACRRAPETKEPNLLACGRCKAVHYCSRKCQRKHWPQHKPHCNAPSGVA